MVVTRNIWVTQLILPPCSGYVKYYCGSMDFNGPIIDRCPVTCNYRNRNYVTTGVWKQLMSTLTMIKLNLITTNHYKVKFDVINIPNLKV